MTRAVTPQGGCQGKSSSWRVAMSKRRNVQFVRDEPSFIRQFKEKIGYKEGPTVDTKRQKLEFNESDDDDDSPEKEDEKPVVVVLQSGDLTAEEVENLQKTQEDEEAISDGKIKFKKPVRKGDSAEKAESVEKTKETQEKGKQKKEKKKKDKPKSNLLSFGAEEEDD